MHDTFLDDQLLWSKNQRVRLKSFRRGLLMSKHCSPKEPLQDEIILKDLCLAHNQPLRQFQD